VWPLISVELLLSKCCVSGVYDSGWLSIDRANIYK
jgi:hypothetical protein